MSKTIDERVVEMRFDNKNFESNVATSMSTIDRLKEKLNFKESGKSLKELEKASSKLDLSGISNAVDTITVKFSALQVAGVTAIANITNSAVNAGKQMVKSLTLDQVTAGFDKYTDKTAYVQTIMNATGKSVDEVNKYLEKLMWFSDETSYSFTDMTSALGQFASTGADAEKVIPMITGIANATAFAGKGAREFSSALYNLNQAYGSGYLGLLDWKSLDTQGITSVEKLRQVFIDTAKDLGTLTKEGKTASGELVSVTNIASTLKDKWLTSEVMEESFKKFSEFSDAVYEAVKEGKYETASDAIEGMSGQFSELSETAFKAGQTAKSFTEAIDATKDAVSSGWMTTFEIIFGNIEEATELWTEVTSNLWDLFAAGAESRNEILEDALRGTSGWEELSEQITSTGISMDDFTKHVQETARKYVDDFDDMIAESGSFEESLKNGWLTSDIISETLNNYADGMYSVTEATGATKKSLDELNDVVKRVLLGEFGNAETRVRKLTEAGYDYKTVQALVNKELYGWEVNLDELSDAQLANIGYTEEQIKMMRELAEEAKKPGSAFGDLANDVGKLSGRDLLIDTFRNTMTSLINVLDATKSAFSEVFGFDANTLYNLIDRIHQLSEYFRIDEERAENLKSTFKGLFSIIDVIATFIKSTLNRVFSALGETINFTGDDILEITGYFGEWLSNWRDFYKETNMAEQALDNFGENVKIVIEAVKEWLDQFIQLPKIQNGLQSIGSFFTGFSDRFTESFTNAKESFSNFINGFRGQQNTAVGDLTDDVDVLNDAVTTYANNSQGKMQALTTAVETFKGSVSSVFESIRAKVSDVVEVAGYCLDYLKQRFEGFNIYPVAAIAFSLSIVKMAENISAAIARFAKSVVQPLDLIKSVVNAFNKVLNAQAMKYKADALLTMAEAIGVLALAIALIAFIPQDQANRALVTVGIASAIMAALAVAVGMFNKVGDNMGKASLSFAALGLGVLILVKALMDLSDAMSTSLAYDYEYSLMIIAALLAELTVSAITIGAFGKGLSVGALSILGFALAVRLLVESLKSLKQSDIDLLNQQTEIILSIAGALAAISFSATKLKLSSALGILAITAAVRLVISALQEIVDMRPADVAKGLVGVGAIFLEFGILTRIIGKAGENAAKAGIGIFAMSAAVLLVIPILKLLDSIPNNTIEKGLKTLGGITLIVSGLIFISQFAGEHAAKAGVMLLLVSGSIIALTGAIALLGEFDETKLWNAVSAIAILEGMMALLVAASGQAKDAEKGITRLIVALGLSAAAIGILMVLPNSDKARSVAEAMAIAILSFAGTCLIVGQAKAINQGVLSKMWVMLGMMSVLGLVIAAFSNFSGSWDQILALSGGMSVAMLALVTSFKIIEKSNAINAGVLGGLGIMLAIMTGVGAVIALGSNLTSGLDNILEFSAGLSLSMLALSASFAIISAVAPLANAVFPALGAIAAAYGVILALIAATGGIDYLMQGDFASEIERGLDVIELIAVKMAEIMAKSVSVIGTTFTNDMITMAENLSIFTDKLAPFLSVITTLNADDLNGAKVVTDIIKTMGDKSIFNTLKSLANDEDAFSKYDHALSMFAMAMVKFAHYAKLIDVDAIEKSEPAVTTLNSLLSALPSTGGFINRLKGEQSWSTIGDNLAEFGSAMKRYSISVKGLDVESIQNSIPGGEALNGLLSALPSEGGLFGAIFGEQSWDTIRAGLVSFGEAMKKYGEWAAQWDNDAIEKSAGTAEYVVKLSNLLNSSGGLVQDVFGEKNWASVTQGLVDFGSAMAEFSSTVTGSDITRLSSAATALDHLTNEIHDALADTYFDTFNIQYYSERLDEYGTAMTNFASQVSDISGVDNVVDVSQKVLGFFTNLNNSKSNIPSKTTMEDYSSAMSTLGNGILKYYLHIKQVDVDVFSKVTHAVARLFESIGDVTDTNVLTELSKDLSEAGDLGITAFVNSIDVGNTTVATSVKTLISTFSKTFFEEIKRIKSLIVVYGSILVNNISEGITDKKDTIKDALLETIQNGLDSIPTLYEKFEEAGKKAAESFASGLSKTKTGDGIMTAYNKKNAFRRGKLNSDDTRKITKDMKTATKTATQTQNAVDGVIDTVTGFVSGVGDKVDQTSLDGFLGNVTGFIGNAKESVTNWFGDFASNATQNILGTNGINIEEMLSGTVDGITSSIGSSFSVLDKDATKTLNSAKKEYDALLENYKNGKINQAKYDAQYTALLAKYTDIQAELADYANEKLFPMAKSEFDDVLKHYKNGRINQAEYDKQYTEILKKYTSVQIETMEYAQDKMADYVQTSFDKINTEYEKKITKIQGKMDTFTEKHTGSFEDMFTFKTNKDTYDEKIKEYEEKTKKYQYQIDELNDKKEKTVKLYGEESYQAQEYQKRIDKLTESMNEVEKKENKYKRDYDQSGKKDDEIINTMFPTNEEMDEKIKEVNKYTKYYKALQKKNVSQTALDAISEMDDDKAMATMKYLLKLSDEELANTSAKWEEWREANESLTKTVFTKQITDATTEYYDSIYGKLSELPDSAKLIGINTAKNLAEGLSEETINSLSAIGLTVDGIEKAIEDMLTKSTTNAATTTLKNTLQSTADGVWKDLSTPGLYKGLQVYTGGSSITPVIKMDDTSAWDKVNMKNLTSQNKAFDVNNILKYSSDSGKLYEAVDGLKDYINAKDGTSLTMIDILDTIAEKMDTAIMNKSGQQLVLDTGALVGGIVDKIDKKLGQKSVMKGRGG